MSKYAPDKYRLTIFLDKGLYKKLKIKAIQAEIPLSKLIEQIGKEYINEPRER